MNETHCEEVKELKKMRQLGGQESLINDVTRTQTEGSGESGCERVS